jgi:hypothetical protein
MSLSLSRLASSNLLCSAVYWLGAVAGVIYGILTAIWNKGRLLLLQRHEYFHLYSFIWVGSIFHTGCPGWGPGTPNREGDSFWPGWSWQSAQLPCPKTDTLLTLQGENFLRLGDYQEVQIFWKPFASFLYPWYLPFMFVSSLSGLSFYGSKWFVYSFSSGLFLISLAKFLRWSSWCIVLAGRSCKGSWDPCGLSEILAVGKAAESHLSA